MLLELNNISKYFPVKKGFLSKTTSYVHAVENVELKVRQGESLALVGESGCGKTTLARMILKLLPATSGSITFDGQDITNLSGSRLRPVRKNMQIVFQDPFSSLDPRYTIRKVLKEATCLDKERYKNEKERMERMVQLLKAVGLQPDVLYRFPHEFSGGERQRIAIARALMLNPKLLILDEAVSSLDVLIQQQIIDLLNGLKNDFQLTYLFITHNLKIVKKVCQKIAVMYQGRIVELGTIRQIFDDPLHPYTQELLLAAVKYKAVNKDKPHEIAPNSRLVDRGGGHFVMEVSD